MNRIKFVFIILLLILTFGCGNDTKKDDINNYVMNNSSSLIINKLKECVNNVNMFPSKDSEEELIYYVMAIKDNKEKFSSEELNNFNVILQTNYEFKYNSLSYDNNDYQDDLNVIK